MLAISKPLSQEKVNQPSSKRCLRALGENIGNVSRALKDSDNLQRMGPGIVHDDVIWVWLDRPESEREFSQILADVLPERPFDQKSASLIKGLLNPIDSIHAIARDGVPDFEEVVRGLRSETVEAHPRC